MSEKDWLQAGIAQVCITPDLGCSLGGYPYKRVAESVLSDLHAKALVLENGGKRIALVTTDLVCLTREVVASARERIAQQCGIEPEAVMVCATHTHTGPEIRYRKDRPYGPDPKYNEALVQSIADVVLQAGEQMFDAWLYVGQTQVDGYSRNRLQRLKSGQDVISYHMTGAAGDDEDSIVGPAGPLDRSLYTLCIRDAQKRVRAMAINFAAHPNKRGPNDNEIWAEWPGETARVIRTVYGENVPCLMLQGACGDIDCVQGLHRDWVGRGIAGAAVMANERVAIPLKDLRLESRLDVLDIPYCCRSSEILRKLEDRGQANASGEEALPVAYKVWDKDNQVADVPVQCFRIGDMAIVGLPFEAFNSLGLTIKQFSPAEQTFVVGYANEMYGYLPPASQAQRGGYGETPILTRKLEDQAGERVVDAAVRALHAMWD